MADDPARHRRWLSHLRMDFRPLRTSPDFRRLFASRTVTLLGSQITEVAQLVHLTELTRNPLAVGLLGAAQVVPIVLFGLYGGVLADRLDRRRLALWCEGGLAVVTSGLVVDAALPHPALWPLYAAAAGIMSLSALQQPSLDAAVPRVVAKDQIAASAALVSISSTSTAVVGPAVGGLLVVGPGAAWAYGIDTATFVVSFLLLFGLRAMPRTDGEVDPRGLRGVLDGLRYAVDRRDLLGSYLVDLVAMIFAFPAALLPFMAVELRAEWAQGLLFSASAAGALLASATSGWIRHVHRYGRAIACSAATWGVALVGFGLSRDIGMAVALLVIAGGADEFSGIFRDTLWNTTIPDRMRGRMAGLELLSYGGGPVLGQIRGGAVAGHFGVRRAVWTGGVACVVAVGAICAALPRLWSFDAAPPPDHVVHDGL